MRTFIAFLIFLTSCNFAKPESATAELALLEALSALECKGGEVKGNGIPFEGVPNAVFVFAGQSNMVGRANDREEPVNVIGAYIWTGSRWEGLQSQTHVGQIGPEYSFAVRWLADHPGQSVGIVKYACGGSYVQEWTPEKPFANRLLSAFLRSGSPNIQGFFWMQGESESMHCKGVDLYKVETQNLIDWQYRVFGSKKFVLGQTQKMGPCGSIVRDAQRTVERGSIVNIDDLLTESDGVHLNKQAQIEFGKRLYSEFYKE